MQMDILDCSSSTLLFIELESIVPNTMRASVAFAASGEPAVQLLFQVHM